jgi:hypothetical protein
MKVLYITTFNEKLYNMTGKNLVGSFLKHVVNGDLLVCYEDIKFSSTSLRILTYDINNSEFMNNWLKTYSGDIPQLYNGTAENDDPRFVEDKKKGQGWARFRASKYFRKIVALEYFIENLQDEYDTVCLIDSDCIFRKNLRYFTISKLLANDTSMAYFWGQHRRRKNRGPETGFTAYSFDNHGFDFIKIIVDCFKSGDFKKYEYWDDGFVIGRLIEENKNKFIFNDIVGESACRTTRVMEIPDQLLYGIVHHFKNSHATPDELKWVN